MSAQSDSAYLRTITDRLFVKRVFAGDLESCRHQGAAAGDQAYRRDQNPYEVGTADREWWDAGWCSSLDELCGH